MVASRANPPAPAADRNRKTLEELEAANRVNPTKVGEWYKKGVEVKKQSDELFEYIQQLKLRIIRQADGKDANVDQLQHKEDLDAASEIMLSPMGSEAAKLKKRLELSYTKTIVWLEKFHCVSENRGLIKMGFHWMGAIRS